MFLLRFVVLWFKFELVKYFLIMCCIYKLLEMKIQIFDKTSADPPNYLAIIYLMLFFLSFVLGLLSKLVYRKYIYLHHLNDFGLADSLPSFFAVLGISFATLSFYQFKHAKISYSIFAMSALSMIAYEISQKVEFGVFDLNDIVASLMGGVFALAVYRVLNKIFVKSA